MKVRFIGGTPAVDLALPGERWLRCERHAPVEVPDEVGESLIQQADWEAVDPPKPPKGGKTPLVGQADDAPPKQEGGE